MPIEGVREGEFVSFDGTTIRYQDVGEGPPIVFANGLGGTYEAWVHMIDHLKHEHRILSWDYRGMYGSEKPPLSRLRIQDHVRDMETLLQVAGVDEALLFGWSMGTQVSLEFYRRNPEKALGIMLICGAAGRPFDTALNLPISKYVLPPVFRGLKKIHRVQGAVIKAVVRIPFSLELFKITGMLAKDGDIDTFYRMANDYANLDFEAYNEIMLGLGEHDARDVLPTVRVPTVIFAAELDFFTPDYISEEMHRLIPGSRLVHIKGAGHYAPLEFPQMFNEEIDAFFAEHFRHLRDGADSTPEPVTKKSAAPKKPAAKKSARKPPAKKAVKKAPAKKTARKTASKKKAPAKKKAAASTKRK